MFDGRWRWAVERGVGPVGRALHRTGLAPDHLTVAGLLFAAGSALAIGSGRLGLGLALLIASALPDLLDGALAKASGTASQRGAFFDSVADRIADSLVLGGFGWYLASARGGHWAVLPLALLGASQLVSYERAKAESLHIEAKGGLMERAERVVALCVSLAFSVAMVPILAAMLALTLLTAVQRFVRVWRVADAPPPRPRRRVLGARVPRRWEGRRAWSRRAWSRRAAREPRRARRSWRPGAHRPH